MPAAPAMTPARWAVLAGGLPVVLALIAFATYGWVNGTVLYLADQGQVGYPVGFSAPTTGGQARVTEQRRRASRCGPAPAAGSWSAGISAAASPGPRSVMGRTPDGLALNPQCHVPAGTCSLDLGVTVPAGLPVRVSERASATWSARGLHGTVTLADTSGDMTASQLSGTMHVTDGFGTSPLPACPAASSWTTTPATSRRPG